MQIGDIIFYFIFVPAAITYCYWMVRERPHIKQQMQYGSLYRSALVMAVADQHEARPLSQKELKAVYCLSKMQPKGMYAEMILQSIATGNETVIRTVLKELREQLRVAPAEMEQLIGKDCCELIKN